MSEIELYEIYPTDKYNDDIKYYIKKKKFTKIEDDISDILDELEKGNFIGSPIVDIISNNKTYKVRAANTNTNQGKSNGYRLIYYVELEEKFVFLITIYYKKDDNRIPTDKEITDMIEKYCL